MALPGHISSIKHAECFTSCLHKTTALEKGTFSHGKNQHTSGRRASRKKYLEALKSQIGDCRTVKVPLQ